MSSLRPVIRLIQSWWWNWARKELQSWCPTHPDLPRVIHRCNELERS